MLAGVAARAGALLVRPGTAPDTSLRNRRIDPDRCAHVHRDHHVADRVNRQLGPLHDPRLTARPPALDPADLEVARLAWAVRKAVPKSHGVEIVRLDDPDGTFQARFTLDTPAGEAEVLIDRREMGTEPYESTKAGLVRGGHGHWELSLDHDPELDHEAAWLLARRVATSFDS